MKYDKREKPRLEHEKHCRLNKKQRQERRAVARADRHRRRYERKAAAEAELLQQLREPQEIEDLLEADYEF